MYHTLLVVRRGAQLSIIAFASVSTYKVIGLLGSGIIDQFVNGGRIWVCPSEKEIIRRSGNCSKFCMVAAGCYQYLVVDKQQFVTFLLLTVIQLVTAIIAARVDVIRRYIRGIDPNAGDQRVLDPDRSPPSSG